MKKSLKIVYILFIFISIMFLLQNVVLAYDPGPNGPPSSSSSSSSSGGSSSGGWAGQMLTDAENWGTTNDGGIAKTTQTIIGTSITVIRIVGMGIAIIMTTYVAIKYMSAAPNEKAEFKKSATGLIVGAVVLFATTQILGIIANFATNNISS